MTSEERAKKAAGEIIAFVPIRQAAGCGPFHPDQMAAIIEHEIREAVAAEREECALIALGYDGRISGQGEGVPESIAEDIRKRGTS